MSINCCDDKLDELKALRETQSRVLKVVLLINTLMFFVEVTAGIAAHSTALLADSLDMLGDAVVYAFTLFVLNRTARWQAGASLLKGLIMAAFGVGVVVEALTKAIAHTIPQSTTMGLIGLLALTANGICLFLLTSHRNDNLNMRSTWLCSMNDIVSNLGVLVAAFLVHRTYSFWPDVIVGLIIALVSLRSAYTVIKDSIIELRSGTEHE